MAKYSNIVLWVLMAISVAMLVYFGVAPTESLQQTTGSYIDVSTGLDMYLYWTEGIVFLAIAALVILSIINFKNDIKGALEGLAGILAVVVLLVVCYFISDGQELVRVVNGETEVITEFWMKAIDMWCYSIYALLTITVVLVIVFPILRMLGIRK